MIRFPHATLVPTILAFTLLDGCTVGPNFEPPRSTDATDFHQRAQGDGTVSPSADPDPQWWNAFGDPILTHLMTVAIAGNLDLQQAVLRVVESRQSVIEARAAGLPSLNGTGSYMREQLGARGILESDGVYRQLNSLADQGSPLNAYKPGLGGEVSRVGNAVLDQATQPTSLFQYGLDASWELDLFGRVRRTVEETEATAQAQSEATNDSLLMLESEVAQIYVQFRSAQTLAANQAQSVANDQKVLDLTQRLYLQGLDSDLDVDQARTQLYNDQRQQPDNDQRQQPGYEKQAQQALDQMNVLTGQPPGTLDAMLAPAASLPALPTVVGIGLPSTLARRRPDIREAEAQLHAATANVGVAVASFYPDVSLTGNLGLRATDASYLTRWASHFYSAGPSISLPIFQGGQLSASLTMARAEQREAALHYRGTVLNALREVEDGLVAYRADRATRDRLADTAASAEDTLYLATSLYSNGLADFLQVLDSQRTLVSARQQLVQAETALLDDVVTLYRAVGGGWQDSQAAVAPPVIAAEPPPLPAALDGLVP